MSSESTSDAMAVVMVSYRCSDNTSGFLTMMLYALPAMVAIGLGLFHAIPPLINKKYGKIDALAMGIITILLHLSIHTMLMAMGIAIERNQILNFSIGNFTRCLTGAHSMLLVIGICSAVMCTALWVAYKIFVKRKKNKDENPGDTGFSVAALSDSTRLQ